MHSKPILIAGAGPGGLAAALTLHERGIPVRVFEAVNALKPLGVGINLLPHSVAILHRLGLQPQLDRIAVHTAELRYTNKFGQLIWQEPRGIAAGYDVPQYSIHRGLLQMLLLDVVRERLGPDQVQTGCALEGWRDTADGVAAIVRYTDGSVVEIDGSALIAADGIHSTARKGLFPDEGEPKYGGRVLWRGVSRCAPFLDGRTMIMSGYQDQKFVCYPIAPEPDAHGDTLLNWIAELRIPVWEPPPVAPGQHWNRAVAADRFAGAFSAWRFDWLDVPAIIDRADAIYEYPLVDRDPLPRWTHGRVTLLGDAAHPMYPVGSNGASQAILDADALAACIAHSDDDDVAQALQSYEAQRRPPTTNIVLNNRQNGPEQVMQLAEERAPDGFTNIDDVIPLEERQAISARYKQTAGFSVKQVNRQ